MDDIGPECDMDGDRDAQSARSLKYWWRGKETAFIAVDVVADRLAEAFSFFGAATDRFIQHPSSFFRHAETSVVDFRIYFLRGVAHEGQLEIMDDYGTVHGHAVTIPRSIKFVRMGERPTFITWAPIPTITGRRFDGPDNGAETALSVLTARISGRVAKNVCNDPPLPGLGEVRDLDFAVTLFQRIGLEGRDVNRRN